MPVKILKTTELYTLNVNCMVCELYLNKAVFKNLNNQHRQSIASGHALALSAHPLLSQSLCGSAFLILPSLTNWYYPHGLRVPLIICILEARESFLSFLERADFSDHPNCFCVFQIYICRL